MYDEFEALDAVAVAISQEDTDINQFAGMPLRFEGRFPILADLNRGSTPMFDRTTAYLIDKRGVVREIFPMIIHARPSWRVVLRELEALEKAPLEASAPARK